jgi:type IV fimbrial biogenesis protein FimT
MSSRASSTIARSSRGFTLVELMVTIAILAILATIGLPSFQRLISDYRVSAQANGVQGLLQFARSEAVKRRQPVVVCRGPADLVVRLENCATGELLRVLPIDPRVTLGGMLAPGLEPPGGSISYLPAGYASIGSTVIFLPVSSGISNGRQIRLAPSGFSEVIKL